VPLPIQPISRRNYLSKSAAGAPNPPALPLEAHLPFAQRLEGRCKGNQGIEGRYVGTVESRETPRCFCAKAGFWNGGGKGGNRIRNAATGGTSETWNREVNTFRRGKGHATDCKLESTQAFQHDS
jgi:hypothetical protein